MAGSDVDPDQDGRIAGLGGLQGCLAEVPAPDLAATAIAATVARSGVPAEDIDEVFMGYYNGDSADQDAPETGGA